MGLRLQPDRERLGRLASTLALLLPPGPRQANVCEEVFIWVHSNTQKVKKKKRKKKDDAA